MRTVHKFPVQPTENGWFELEIPALARPVLIAAQMGRTQMWVDLDTDYPPITRRFLLVGTGQPIPRAEDTVHVESFLMNNGMFVWHVYEARS